MVFSDMLFVSASFVRQDFIFFIQNVFDPKMLLYKLGVFGLWPRVLVFLLLGTLFMLWQQEVGHCP